MLTVAILLGAWMTLRWLSVLVGLVRVRRFQGPVRREARRSCVARGAVTMIGTVVTFYTWTVALELYPTPEAVGTTGMLIMVSLVAWVLAAFMQPAERTPETLDIFRLRPLRARPAQQAESQAE